MLFAQRIGLCWSRLEKEAQIGISLYIFFNTTPQWVCCCGTHKERPISTRISVMFVLIITSRKDIFNVFQCNDSRKSTSHIYLIF